jgi:TonB family protein
MSIPLLASFLKTGMHALPKSILLNPIDSTMKNVFILMGLAVLALSSCGTSPEAPAPAEAASNNEVISAEFPGGTNAILDFIGGHVEYPEAARDLNLTGSVHVQFTISESGAVTDAFVLRGAHPLLDSAAVEAAMALPDFAPATRGGNPISTTMTLPVQFRLN